MGGLSKAYQKQVGDSLLLKAKWMGLNTADPTDDALTSTEVPTSGTNYSRVSIDGKMSPFDPATGLSTLNGNVNIGPASIDWGLLTHASFWEDQVGGTMVMSGQLSTAQDTPAGKQFQLLAGQFSIKID